MATEYIFFDAALCERFIRYAAAQGLAGSMRADPMDGYVAALPDDLADAVEAACEAEYEALMDEQRAEVEAEEGGQARDLMGVSVALPDGTPCVVRLPAGMARRLFEHFAADEIHALVAAIALSVADPQTGPICRMEPAVAER